MTSAPLPIHTEERESPGRNVAGLTPREQTALDFLDDKMEATAAMVGRAIYNSMNGRGGSNLATIGGNVMGALRKRGLVMFLSDLRAWRITRNGRLARSHIHAFCDFCNDYHVPSAPTCKARPQPRVMR